MAEPLRVIVIAGPDGAGKTTFAREFLPNEADCPVFVNADLIAAGLAPFAPETAALQAGRLMLRQLERHFAARRSFAFETTLSGCAYLRQVARWQAAGYRVKLVFLRLDGPDEAVARVAQRVEQGGHDIPADVIRRRFSAGLHNFRRFYAPLVDAWALYDNSGSTPVMLEWKPISSARDPDLRQSQAALERAARRAHELAARTGTRIVVSRNGVVEHIAPTPQPHVESACEPPGRRENGT